MPYTSTSFPIKKPETVIKAIKAFLDWTRAGRDARSFAYTDPNDPNEICSYSTVMRYMKDEEFIAEHGLACLPEHREHAKSMGYAIWEEIVSDSAKGINKEANTASLQMVMRNKFGWDKKEEFSDEHESSQKSAYERIRRLSDAMTRVVSSKPSVDKEYKEDLY